MGNAQQRGHHRLKCVRVYYIAPVNQFTIEVLGQLIISEQLTQMCALLDNSCLNAIHSQACYIEFISML